MKRKFAVLLALCMLVNLLGLPALADGEEEIIIPAVEQIATETEVKTLSENNDSEPAEEEERSISEPAQQATENITNEPNQEEKPSIVEEMPSNNGDKEDNEEEVISDNNLTDERNEENSSLTGVYSDPEEKAEENDEKEEVLSIPDQNLQDLENSEKEEAFEPGLITINAGKRIYNSSACNLSDSYELAEVAVVYAEGTDQGILKVAYALAGIKTSGYVKETEAQRVNDVTEYMNESENSIVKCAEFFLPNVEIIIPQQEEEQTTAEIIEYAESSDTNAQDEENDEQEEQNIGEPVIEDSTDEEETPDIIVVIEEAETQDKQTESEETDEIIINDTNEILLTGTAPNDATFTVTAAGVITECISEATDIIIPEKVTVNGSSVTITGISETAFAKNTSITSVLINNATSLTSIAKGCFQGCTSLRSVSFPNSILIIPDDAFKDCTSLISISWPATLTTIGANTFEGCTALTSITLPASVTSIGKSAFEDCSAMTNANLQDGIITIGSAAFRNCAKLKGIYIPNTVTSMGNSAFENCSSATVLSLSTALTEINNFTFLGCSSLADIEIPNGVTQIGREAFCDCGSVTSVDIPSTVATIGAEAFAGINSNSVITMYSKNATIGTDAFGNEGSIFAYADSTTETYTKNHSDIVFYAIELADIVRVAYQGILNRKVDRQSFVTKTRQLKDQEITVAEMIARLLRSDEYKKRNLNDSDAVEALYKGILNRASDSAGKTKKMEMLTDGVTICYVANTMIQSDEFKAICRKARVNPGEIAPIENRDKNYQTTAFVSRCYDKLLGRKFDVNGLNNWTGRLLSGTHSGATMVQGFLRSSEYAKLGLTNDQAIERLYNTMLKRASDPTGKANWMAVMDAGCSIERVAYGFSLSAEFKYICETYQINPGVVELIQNRDKNIQVTKFVARCYEKALGRKYDVNGLNNWTGRIMSGEYTPQQVAYGFVFSNECLKKNMNNADFVTMLYGLYMNRTPDTTGYNNWMNRISKGMTRREVATRFGESAEFRKIVASYGL